MFKNRNVRHYAGIIAKERGLPEIRVRKALMFMMMNLCKMIERGEDVRIKGFGRIYFEKFPHKALDEAQNKK
jgi:nucleoid DNA-binding protein